MRRWRIVSPASGRVLICAAGALLHNERCARSGTASLGRPPISEGDACPTFIDESSGEIMEVCVAAQNTVQQHAGLLLVSDSATSRR